MDLDTLTEIEIFNFKVLYYFSFLKIGFKNKSNIHGLFVNFIQSYHKVFDLNIAESKITRHIETKKLTEILANIIPDFCKTLQIMNSDIITNLLIKLEKMDYITKYNQDKIRLSKKFLKFLNKNFKKYLNHDLSIPYHIFLMNIFQTYIIGLEKSKGSYFWFKIFVEAINLDSFVNTDNNLLDLKNFIYKSQFKKEFDTMLEFDNFQLVIENYVKIKISENNNIITSKKRKFS